MFKPIYSLFRHFHSHVSSSRIHPYRLIRNPNSVSLRLHLHLRSCEMLYDKRYQQFLSEKCFPIKFSCTPENDILLHLYEWALRAGTYIRACCVCVCVLLFYRNQSRTTNVHTYTFFSTGIYFNSSTTLYLDLWVNILKSFKYWYSHQINGHGSEHLLSVLSCNALAHCVRRRSEDRMRVQQFK